MAKETFADRLKQAMDEKGKKQIDIIRAAAEQGVKLGKSHISQYVSGKNIPRTDILHCLAEVLGVDEEWLRNGNKASDAPADEAAGAQDANTRAVHPAGEIQAGGSAAKSVFPVTDGAGEIKKAGSSGGRPMREFRKSSKLNNVLYDVRGPVVDEAARMEEAGTQILKLNIGNPAPFGFRTPDEVIYDMRRQLTECEGYSPANGLFSARKAIMQYAQLKQSPMWEWMIFTLETASVS